MRDRNPAIRGMAVGPRSRMRCAPTGQESAQATGGKRSTKAAPPSVSERSTSISPR